MTAAALTAGLVLWSRTAIAEAYRLQQGDLLELVVLAPQEIREPMRVDINGSVTVPLAGVVLAEGRSVEDLAAEIRGKLSSIALPPMLAGETLPTQLWPSAISLTLKEYRPVYVGGDVQKAGAFSFTPGLTARRAIALAGGYGFAGLTGSDPRLRRLELRSELGELVTERAGAFARLDRLKRELGTDAPSLPEANGPVADAERAILVLRRDQDASAVRHFGSAISQAEEQVTGLRAQLATETEGMAADREDFDKLRDMRADGTVTALRLTDARRALLFSTTRQLETASELVRTRRDLGSVEYEQERRRQDLRLETMRELAEVTNTLAVLDAQIAGAESRIAYLDRMAPAEANVIISITGSDGARVALAPGSDGALRPGDLVIVTVAAGEPPG